MLLAVLKHSGFFWLLCTLQIMAFPNMGKDFYGALVAVLSFLILMMAIWLSLILRPPIPTRPSSAHVVTVNQPPVVTLSVVSKSRPPPHYKLTQVPASLTNDQREQCYRTCHLELVESLPENLTFNTHDEVRPPLAFTHESWMRLLDMAERRVTMAAYKSSFRGRHVLDDEFLSSGRLGDRVFDRLRAIGVEQNGIKLEAVENYPPKDRGDNEDVAALTESGLMERRRLNMARIARSGVMHSKFLLVDDSHFYLGSANFDWRSLNQKMELGVHVERCPCLANELRILYDAYWAAAVDSSDDLPDQSSFNDLPALTSSSNPLIIRVGGVDTEVHIAASPRRLNGQKRDWDLDAIVRVIDEAEHRLDIHVMDYVPLFVYQKPKRFWPVIDDALRRAVIERGVRIRFLTAALHFTSESLHALRSLEIMGQAVVPSNGGRVEVRILNIPAVTAAHRSFARERRTHRKFMLNDDTLLIGTSNWSGDYFANTTGVAIVMRQKGDAADSANGESGVDAAEDVRSRPLIDQARRLFERDWHSMYASDLNDYIERCYDRETKRDSCKAGRMAYQQA